MKLDGLNILVAGFARTGQAVVEFLKGFNCTVVVSDSSPATNFGAITPQYPDVQFEFGAHKLETFLKADVIILSPGIPDTIPALVAAREKGIPILSEIELAYRFLKGTIIGITGTNGKSTTTELTGAMLHEGGKRVYVCGNIGTPLVRFCKESKDQDFYVVEISSFQLETILSFKPHIGALINLAEDHLDRYPSVEPYYRAKLRIFENQTSSDFAVVNYDDPYIRANAESIIANKFWFSRKEIPPSGIYEKEGLLKIVSGMPVINFNLGALKGVHNLENTLCAASIALLCGVRPKELQKAIESFRSLPHRMELVNEHNGVQYYDDSKATNADAVVKSLESFPGGIFLILGGRDKGCNLNVVRDLIRQRVKRLLLIGEAKERFARELGDVTEYEFCNSLEEAVDKAAGSATTGDVVLLSPACSSFDMFKNYEERGQVFRNSVGDSIARLKKQ